MTFYPELGAHNNFYDTATTELCTDAVRVNPTRSSCGVVVNIFSFFDTGGATDFSFTFTVYHRDPDFLSVNF